MVNKIMEFSQKVPREFEKEIETLHKLGIESYEIKYLIYLKIKENMIVKMN